MTTLLPVDYIKVSGAIFRDMTIHDFDIVRWLLNDEIVKVFATGSNLISPAIKESGDIDVAMTILTTKSGKLCYISNSRCAVYGYDQRIEAFCSKGMIQVKNLTETTVSVSTEEVCIQINLCISS
jgi:myo-inositol 2-dehydrogenase/D-chiro-inositol 1-dehydrogenase